MERSATARPAIGRVALPFELPLRLPARVALLTLLLALALLGGGFLLLRHSSLVAVEHVRISGVHGAEAQAIDAALESAARRMSTLDVNTAALSASVSQFRVVRSVTARSRFPHGLQVEVVEQPPVAVLVVAGVRTAVAADGVVLGPALISSSLPAIGGWVVRPPGAELRDRGLLEALRALGAAPRGVRAHVARAYYGAQGLTVAMRNGLVVYFGDGTRPHAKWLSLASVLADTSSQGAIYVDVRVPGRPAAGFPAGAAPALSTAGGEQTLSSSGSPVGTLAESLSGAGGTTGSHEEEAMGEGTTASEGKAAGESTTSGAASGAAEAPTPGG